jgi:hypothetical protein
MLYNLLLQQLCEPPLQQGYGLLKKFIESVTATLSFDKAQDKLAQGDKQSLEFRSHCTLQSPIYLIEKLLKIDVRVMNSAL